MAKARRYKIWDKQEPVYTQVGEVLTPEEWIGRYPIINKPGVVPIVAAGEINGGYSGTLGQLRQIAESQGAVFSDSLTDEELLEAIEDFEEELAAAAASYVPAEERTAAALEFLAMTSLPDEN